MISLCLSASLLFLSVFAQDNSGCLSGRDLGDSSCGNPSSRKFYYDPKTKLCQPFMYKGCSGNGNRFDTREECLSTCKNATLPAGVRKPGETVRCAAGNPAAVDGTNTPLPCTNCPSGYNCESEVCCATKEVTCSKNYDAGKINNPLQSYQPRENPGHPDSNYYYVNNSCQLFTYYGHLGNSNNFVNYNQCMKFCAN